MANNPYRSFSWPEAAFQTRSHRHIGAIQETTEREFFFFFFCSVLICVSFYCFFMGSDCGGLPFRCGLVVVPLWSSSRPCVVPTVVSFYFFLLIFWWTCVFCILLWIRTPLEYVAVCHNGVLFCDILAHLGLTLWVCALFLEDQSKEPMWRTRKIGGMERKRGKQAG